MRYPGVLLGAHEALAAAIIDYVSQQLKPRRRGAGTLAARRPANRSLNANRNYSKR
jgi:hypothetical protein